MDIERIARQVNARLAARPSRRGVVAAVGRLAAGAGAVAAGLRAGQALAQYPPIEGTCCTGARACRTTDRCGAGTKKRWGWSCDCAPGQCEGSYWCQDCDKPGNRSVNVCVYAIPQ